MSGSIDQAAADGLDLGMDPLWFDWSKVDWTNAFFVAIAVTVVVGAPIGVILSLGSARLVVFYQEIQRAREAVLSILDKYLAMSNESNESAAVRQVQWLLVAPASSMRLQLLQTRAAVEMGNIARRIELRLLEEWSVYRSHVGKPTEVQVFDFNARKIKDVLDRGLADLDKIRPDYFTLFFPIKAIAGVVGPVI